MTGTLDFDGDTFDHGMDGKRLTAQLRAVRDLMLDGQWRTFEEISAALGRDYPPQSVSARLRDLRKKRFGEHTVLRRRRGDGRKGLFEYRVGEPEDQ